jgi:DNA (cytosine-5)-methyltransferase 1
MKFLSLFAGIGGFDLGLERVGMQCIGQIEINPFCQRVLAQHWPDVKRIGDIRDVKETEFGTVDLICGGFPCQPFSTAGKRKGKDNDRYLWPEMLRVIEAYRPTWVIGENVAGIVSMALDNVLFDLEGIGYSVQTFIIPACAVGVPHRRDRVWIVANSTESGLSESRLAGIGKSSTETGKEIYDRLEQQDSHAADTNKCQCDRRRQQNQCPAPSRNKIIDRCKIIADTGNQGLQGSKREQSIRLSGQSDRGWCNEKPNWQENWLEVASRLCRVDDGVSGRVDRLKALGNAVVPQIVEKIGRAIMQANQDARSGQGETGEHLTTHKNCHFDFGS